MRSHEVIVVVRRPGPQFLVLLRSLERGGYWNLPAGGVEPGETAAEAAARELLEETGSRADVKELPVQLGYEKPWGRVTLAAFSADVSRAWEPVLDDEHVEHRWCSEDDARLLLAYPEPREAVRVAAQAVVA